MLRKVMTKKNQEKRPPVGSPVYSSIQEALNIADPGDVIEIYPGRYEEKLEVTTDKITLRGREGDRCVITFSDYAKKPAMSGGNYGTFRSYTLLILADEVKVENLTIENRAGDGRKVGQAIALYARGDKLEFDNCHLIGHQDTVFAGPLPEKPVIPGSFIGPTEMLPYKTCRQFYTKCRITGDVDYIFGSALAVFMDCEMMTRNRNETVNGFVTAPSTWKEEPYGFVFIKSRFIGQPGIGDASVYLGRPWRPYGQVTCVDCSWDRSTHSDLWDPWGNKENFKTARLKANVPMGDMYQLLDSWHLGLVQKNGVDYGK